MLLFSLHHQWKEACIYSQVSINDTWYAYTISKQTNINLISYFGQIKLKYQLLLNDTIFWLSDGFDAIQFKYFHGFFHLLILSATSC